MKAAAAALSAAAIVLLVKRTNPEISLLLSACAVTLIVTAAVGFLGGLKELTDAVKTIAGANETLTGPVLKCVAIAIITKLTAELCKDSSQAAAASAVELAGTVCAMSAAMPLVMSMLKMIGGLV